MFVDTHCHIDAIMVKEVVANAVASNVKILVANSTSVSDAYNLVELSKKYSEIKVAIGIHPSDISDLEEDYLIKLEELIKNEEIVAIGEIGLDYYYGKDNQDQQKEVFASQLALAEKYNLPVIVHNRDATNDVLKILKKYKVKGIIHCFCESFDIAKKFIDMGYLLGVNGILTFKNSNLVEVIKKVPLEYIVLETDAPYLTPEPFRGKINESKYIVDIALKLAEIKEMPVEEVRDVTTRNAKSLFDF